MRPIIFPLLMWLCIVAGVITLLLASGCAAPETFQGETGQNPDVLGLASQEHAEQWKRSRK